MLDINYLKFPYAKIESWLQLALTDFVGFKTVMKLLNHFGSVDKILQQSSSSLELIVSSQVALLISKYSSKTLVKKSIDWVQAKSNRYIISLQDKEYPNHLKQIDNPPLILYLEGDISLLSKYKIAIVGTRNPTQYGVDNAFNFARNLAKNDFTIVSGMAMGIDKFAHLGALTESASTIAVLGTGIDIAYPKCNLELYDRIIDKGLLISEFKIGTTPIPNNFPKRNRIIAGMALGCLVVESKLDGGSMITAHCAMEMGRDVMAIPGMINNNTSHGCHKLIKSGAKLVETTNDVLEEFMHLIKYNNIHYDNILQAFHTNTLNINDICKNFNLSFDIVAEKILDLELKGLIVNCGNGYYKKF